MNLLGIPWTAFALGAFALAAGLLALHLLRVRLQRVQVPSLLFFRAAARPERPRVLFGVPRRLLAYLLALAALLAIWSAFADPSLTRAGRSRVVIVDASGSGRAPGAAGATRLQERLARARALAAAGLGPRGAVFASGATTLPLWQAGEAVLLLDARVPGVLASGGGAGLWDTLAAARARLQPGDEVLLLGGPELPGGLDAPDGNGLAVRVLREEAAGPAAGDAGAAEGHSRAPLAVAFVGDVPRAVRLAVAADPALEVVPTPAGAGVVIVRGNEAVTLPCLRILDGDGDLEREPLATPDAPLALGLRDRRQRGPALPADPTATPWIVDARTGAALVQARTTPTREVTIVGWFVGVGAGEVAHQDLPRLVLSSIALVRSADELPPAAAGDTVRVPALGPDVAALHVEGRAEPVLASLASGGGHEIALATPGRYTLRSAEATRTFTVDARATPVPAPSEPMELAPVAHDGHLRSFALWIALGFLLIDLLLYAKGRLP